MAVDNLKPVVWMGSARDDLRNLSPDVQDAIGFALFFAQNGQRHHATKVLKGFGGASVLEIIEDDSAGTYRAVYTVKFSGAVYVLHVFQKKSKRAIATPGREINLVRHRLMQAAAHYEEHHHAFQGKRKKI